MPRRLAGQTGHGNVTPEMTLPEQPGTIHFCSVDSRALLTGRFTAYQLAVLLALQAKAAPTQAEISQMAGMSLATVKRTLKQLTELNEIEVVARWDESGSRLSNIYQYPEGKS